MEAYKEEIYEEFEERGNKMLPVKILKSVHGDEGYSTLPHWHDYMEILYFYKGAAVMQINREHITVRSGQIVLVDAYDIHSVKGASEHLVLLFKPQLASDFYVDLKMSFLISDRDKVLMNSPSENKHIEAVAREMQEIGELHREKPLGYEMSIRGSIYKIIAAIYAYSKGHRQALAGYENNRRSLERLDRLIKYIGEHYSKELTMVDAAKYLNLAPNYFCRFFRSLMGKTFVEYLNMFRCAKAEELIYTTDKSITEIALSTGFSSVSYFNRAYKKYKGICPSGVRKAKDNIVQHDDNIYI